MRILWAWHKVLGRRLQVQDSCWWAGRSRCFLQGWGSWQWMQNSHPGNFGFPGWWWLASICLRLSLCSRVRTQSQLSLWYQVYWVLSWSEVWLGWRKGTHPNCLCWILTSNQHCGWILQWSWMIVSLLQTWHYHCLSGQKDGWLSLWILRSLCKECTLCKHE